MQRRRELMMLGGKPDTSPVILANNAKYVPGGTTATDTQTSITKMYSVSLRTSNTRQALCYGIMPATLNYLDGVYKDYWNQTVTSSPANVTIFNANVNQVCFTLKTSMIDDSYVILSDGEILFAGKNSIYYGYTKTNDMPNA